MHSYNRVAPYLSPILSAFAQLQAGLTGLKRVRLGRGNPTYKALVWERCGKQCFTTHPPIATYMGHQIRVAPYPSPILSALAQLQEGLTGLKRVRLGRGSPTYKALGSAVWERCGKQCFTTHPPIATCMGHQIRVAPYPSPILSALAQLQAGLSGLKRVRLGRGNPTYKAFDNTV